MSKKITNITIKLDSGYNVNIPLAEAKEIYNELKLLFDKGLTFPNHPIYPYGGIPRTPQPYDRTPQWIGGFTCKENTNTIDPSTFQKRRKITTKGD